MRGLEVSFTEKAHQFQACKALCFVQGFEWILKWSLLVKYLMKGVLVNWKAKVVQNRVRVIIFLLFEKVTVRTRFKFITSGKAFWYKQLGLSGFLLKANKKDIVGNKRAPSHSKAVNPYLSASSGKNQTENQTNIQCSVWVQVHLPVICALSVTQRQS